MRQKALPVFPSGRLLSVPRISSEVPAIHVSKFMNEGSIPHALVFEVPVELNGKGVTSAYDAGSVQEILHSEGELEFVLLGAVINGSFPYLVRKSPRYLERLREVFRPSSSFRISNIINKAHRSPWHKNNNRPCVFRHCPSKIPSPFVSRSNKRRIRPLSEDKEGVERRIVPESANKFHRFHEHIALLETGTDIEKTRQAPCRRRSVSSSG